MLSLATVHKGKASKQKLKISKYIKKERKEKEKDMTFAQVPNCLKPTEDVTSGWISLLGSLDLSLAR